jgi:protein-disulfide isomerase
MKAPSLTDGAMTAAAKGSGADLAKMADTAKSDAITQELNRNVQLARDLGFTGTPAWIVGDQALSGAVGYAALKEAVAKARGR